MAADISDGFLDYYTRELAYLRERGADFAAAYPKIAARLGLSGPQVSDPHVERLLEAFAFLTARIQLHLESELPELTTALLGVLYPQYGSPIPSMAIAAFDVDPAEAKLTSGLTLPKHTPLFADSQDGPACRFRTCYPVTLWPVTIKTAEVVPPEVLDVPAYRLQRAAAAIRIRLESGGPPLEALDMRQLRFHLAGNSVASSRLYDLIFAHGVSALVTGADGTVIDAKVEPVGFGPEDDVLHYPPHAHRGYRLLQEYFTFQDKYLFLDVSFERLPTGKEFDILLLLNQRPGSNVSVRADTFRLGCTPIVNLFPKITDPIRVEHRRTEYRLLPDARRERTTEVHSILSVTATAPGEKDTVAYEPFFSYTHRAEGLEPRAFWHSRRAPTGNKEIPGTDVFLSFVDLDFSPKQPPTEAIYASVLCTNRDLAEQVDAGVPLHFEKGAAVARPTCLTKPTPQAAPPLGGQALWRLVSNLSLNHLSLADGPTGADALREILRVYLFAENPIADRQISGIVDVSCEAVTRRAGSGAWRGFCRGSKITLRLDEDRFVGSSLILFTSVLSRFLALHAHLNSFTELVAKSAARDEVLKQWPPMVGEKVLL